MPFYRPCHSVLVPVEYAAVASGLGHRGKEPPGFTNPVAGYIVLYTRGSTDLRRKTAGCQKKEFFPCNMKQMDVISTVSGVAVANPTTHRNVPAPGRAMMITIYDINIVL